MKNTIEARLATTRIATPAACRCCGVDGAHRMTYAEPDVQGEGPVRKTLHYCGFCGDGWIEETHAGPDWVEVVFNHGQIDQLYELFTAGVVVSPGIIHGRTAHWDSPVLGPQGFGESPLGEPTWTYGDVASDMWHTSLTDRRAETRAAVVN